MIRSLIWRSSWICCSASSYVAWAVCASKKWISRTRMKRSEEHTSELQSRFDLVCRLLLEKKKDFYDGDRIRILIAAIYFVLAVLYLIWFVAMFLTTWF